MTKKTQHDTGTYHIHLFTRESYAKPEFTGLAGITEIDADKLPSEEQKPGPFSGENINQEQRDLPSKLVKLQNSQTDSNLSSIYLEHSNRNNIKWFAATVTVMEPLRQALIFAIIRVCQGTYTNHIYVKYKDGSSEHSYATDSVVIRRKKLKPKYLSLNAQLIFMK